MIPFLHFGWLTIPTFGLMVATGLLGFASFPLFVWLNWLAPMLIAAAIVSTVIALVILTRYLLLTRRQATGRTRHDSQSPSPPS